MTWLYYNVRYKKKINNGLTTYLFFCGSGDITIVIKFGEAEDSFELAL